MFASLKLSVSGPRAPVFVALVAFALTVAILAAFEALGRDHARLLLRLAALGLVVTVVIPGRLGRQHELRLLTGPQSIAPLIASLGLIFAGVLVAYLLFA